MQHHELKKYLEFTVNEKPDSKKTAENIKKFHTNRPQFEKKFLLKNDAKLVINGKTRTRFTFLKNFS